MPSAIERAINGILSVLIPEIGRLRSDVTELQQKVDDMAGMKEAVDRVREEVAEAKTVAASAKALVEKLAQMIRDNVGDPTALNALADELDASNQELGAAVTDNTPAEEPTNP